MLKFEKKIRRQKVKGGVLTEQLLLKRDSGPFILRVVAEHLPSLIGNLPYFHVKGKHCVIWGEIHAADDGSPTSHTVVCVCVWPFKRLEVVSSLW